MRELAAATVGVAMLLVGGGMRADAASAECGADRTGQIIYCDGLVSSTLPGSSGGSSTPGTTIPAADQYVGPVLTNRPNGECILIRTIVAPGRATSQNALDGESLLMTLLQ